jgi:hypothetical protein
MKPIKAKHTFEIAEGTRLALSKNHVVALGKDRVIRVLDVQKGAERRLRARAYTARMHALAVSPNGKLAALVFEHHELLLVDIARDEDVQTMKGPFRAALFVDDETLWTVSSPQERMCEWLSHELGSKTAPLSVRFEDPVHASGIALVAHPTARAMFVYVGGGQDGQALFVAQEQPKPTVEEVFNTIDIGVPVVHPSGEEFLIVDGGGFTRYALPSVKPMVSFDWGASYSVHSLEYADSQHAIALNDHGELMRYELASGKLVDEEGKVDAPGEMASFQRFDAELAISTHEPERARGEQPGGGVLAVWKLGRLEAKPAKGKAAAGKAKTAAKGAVVKPPKKAPLNEKWRPTAPDTPAVREVRQRFGAVIDRYGEEEYAALAKKNFSETASYFKPAPVLAQAIRDGYTWPTYEMIRVLQRAGDGETARDLALAIVQCPDLHVDETLVMGTLRVLRDREDAESLRAMLPLSFRTWASSQGQVVQPEKSKCPERTAVIIEYLEEHAPLAAEPRSWPKLDEAAMRAARERKDPWVVVTTAVSHSSSELRAWTLYTLYAAATPGEKQRIVALARSMFARAVDADDRRSAADALVRIDDLDLLLTCLDDADPQVRACAMRALVKKEQGRGFEQAFADCDYDVRLAAVQEMLMVDPTWLYERMHPLVPPKGKVADADVPTLQALVHGLAWTVHRSVPRSWRKDEPRWKELVLAIGRAKVPGTQDRLRELKSELRS